jgi:hypothetical protein
VKWVIIGFLLVRTGWIQNDLGERCPVKATRRGRPWE